MTFFSVPLWIQVMVTLVTILLLFGQMMLLTIELRHRQYTNLVLLPVMLATYLLLALMLNGFRMDAGDEANSQLLELFLSIPFVGILGLLLLIAVMTATIFYSAYQWNRHHISKNSIKEVLDTAPIGVCYYTNDGIVILTNERMQSLSMRLQNQVLTDGKRFVETLSFGPLSKGCALLEEKYEDQVTERLEFLVRMDEEVWRFLVTDQIGEPLQRNGQIHELLAENITEEYTKSKELLERSSELSSFNMRLRKLNDSVSEMTIQQEILNAKIRIHDELGRSLLAARRYLITEGAKREELLQNWKNNLELLGSEPDNTTDEYELVWQAAKDVEVRLEVNGVLPTASHLKAITATAINECITNTIRHAGGDCVRITVIEETGKYIIRFYNNGEPPKKEIQETGGLSSLRTMVEQYGGTMLLEYDPSFCLVLILTKVTNY